MIEDMVGEVQSQIKLKDKNWENKIKKFKLDPTLKWQFAEIIDLNNSEIKFKIINKKEKIFEILKLNNVKWSLKKKKTIFETYMKLEI